MNPMGDPEHCIPMDPFDREYGLEDLLDPGRLAATFRQVEAGGLLRFAICHTDGSRFYPPGPAAASWPVAGASDPRDIVLPLRHELETVGVLHTRPGQGLAPEALPGVADFARAVLEALMTERYRYLMSSRLHGEVVEDSYLRLQQKAEALARSEARYRRLAARLEKEVARQAEEIRATQAHLMERAQLAAIGQLPAGMAHEINNPLGFICSNLSTLDQYGRELAALLTEARRLWGLLADRAHPPAAGHDLCRLADALEDSADRIDLDYLLADLPSLIQESREGAERIRRIVSNLKAFAQPGVETATALDLNRCLEATLEVLADRLDGKVTPMCRFAPLPAVQGCESQINQVFMNVILNAVQASPEGGQIRLHTTVEDGGVRVDISDDGPGIPPDRLRRVFEPFYTTRDVGQGCGLGLTLAYNTIQKHGGTIRVCSPAGEGTTVEIRLPLDARE